MSTDEKLQLLLAAYQPSDATKELVRQSRLVILVGITGAGKNTLKQELLKSDEYYDFISHTTRQPRSNRGIMELNGIDYFFISREKALEMVEAGEFIEAKNVHSNVYGTTTEGLRPSVESARIAVNDVDVQGVDEYKSIAPNVHAIFVLPPSFEEWERRRSDRYQDGGIDPEDNRVRLESARSELNFALEKGYFDFVINDDVEAAAKRVHEIVCGSENVQARDSAIQVAISLRDTISTH